ncbi:hypothetical protein DFJ77DRAFT_548382 [Powellomyces hirtus]|nr:hypothetical protein DFJ77DRAFT_548382 [Powellomyces hirtus]
MITWTQFNLKFACERCQNGHRNGSCAHTDRKLVEIRSKGRPTSQCNHCRAKRKDGVGHSHHRCMCGDGMAILKKKVEVCFRPNLVLAFTPERGNVDALKKQLEENPQSKLLVQRKAKAGKGADAISEIEIHYVKTVIVEETAGVDMQKLMANPCKCQFGGTCICSDLPPSKGCGSGRSKRGSTVSTVGTASPSMGPAITPAMLSTLAALPRPIDLGFSNRGVPANNGQLPIFPSTTGSKLAGHPAILPMPSSAPSYAQLASMAAAMQGNQGGYPFQPQPMATTNITDTRGHDPELLQALFALQRGGVPPQPAANTATSSCCGGTGGTAAMGPARRGGCGSSAGGCGCGSGGKSGGGCGCGCGDNSRAAASSCCGDAKAFAPVSSCCAPPAVEPRASSCCGPKSAPALTPVVSSCCSSSSAPTPNAGVSSQFSEINDYTLDGSGMVMNGGACCSGSSEIRKSSMSIPPQEQSSCGCGGGSSDASVSSSCCSGGGTSGSECRCSDRSSLSDAETSSSRNSGGGCGCSRSASQVSTSRCGGRSDGGGGGGGGCHCNSKRPAVTAPAAGGCCGPKPQPRASCCGSGNMHTGIPMQSSASTTAQCDCGCHADKSICGNCEADLCPLHLLGTVSDEATTAMFQELDELTSMGTPMAASTSYQNQFADTTSNSGTLLRSSSCVAVEDPFNMAGLRDALCGCGCEGGTEGRVCQCG